MAGRSSDLFCLVADKNTEQTLRAILPRWQALGTRPFGFEIAVHPEHDPGCRLRSESFLRPFRARFEHTLVIFDLEGSGPMDRRENLEAELESELVRSGWAEGKVAVVVIDPELESWLWNDSPHVAKMLGWESRRELSKFLDQENFELGVAGKPRRPKEAAEKALYHRRIPRSSAIYGELAGRVSFRRCGDPAFGKLLTTLRRWFGEATDIEDRGPPLAAAGRNG